MQKTTITGLFLMLFGILAQGQTTQVTPFFRQQFFSDTGAIAAGYKLCAYQAGTSTPLNTYTDQGGGTPNANPVILDATGSGNIWLLNRSYKLVLRQPGTDNTCNTGTIVKTVDNVAPFYRYSGTAAPVTGTYQTGDFVWNTGPVTTPGSTSAVLGWTCTAGGTPGTWAAVSGTLADHLPRPVTVDQTLTVTGVFTAGAAASNKSTTTLATVPNYIASETGANNAIAGALVDANGTNVPLAAGLCVFVKLAHTLQTGTNTFNYNAGGALSIKSHFDPSQNNGGSYANNGIWQGCYDGTVWEDMAR